MCVCVCVCVCVRVCVCVSARARVLRRNGLCLLAIDIVQRLVRKQAECAAKVHPPRHNLFEVLVVHRHEREPCHCSGSGERARGVRHTNTNLERESRAASPGWAPSTGARIGRSSSRSYSQRVSNASKVDGQRYLRVESMRRQPRVVNPMKSYRPKVGVPQRSWNKSRQLSP